MEEKNIPEKEQKVKVKSIDKILLIIALFLLLSLLLVSAYFLVKSDFNFNHKMNEGNLMQSGNILNLDKEKAISNPTSEDLQNLVNELKDQNSKLELELE